VISCLRINDRKPLDCWKEVEIFKREVRKMEENYVSSIL
jgi:MICOS complex subunit MIC19